MIIYDFLGLDAMSKNPLEHFIGFFFNRIWSLDYKIFTRGKNLALFVGEPEDIPDKRFSFALPNRRAYKNITIFLVIYYLLIQTNIIIKKE